MNKCNESEEDSLPLTVCFITRQVYTLKDRFGFCLKIAQKNRSKIMYVHYNCIKYVLFRLFVIRQIGNISISP